MDINQLIAWLEQQAHKAATYPERVAYNKVIKHVKDSQCKK